MVQRRNCETSPTVSVIRSPAVTSVVPHQNITGGYYNVLTHVQFFPSDGRKHKLLKYNCLKERTRRYKFECNCYKMILYKIR